MNKVLQGIQKLCWYEITRVEGNTRWADISTTTVTNRLGIRGRLDLVYILNLYENRTPDQLIIPAFTTDYRQISVTDTSLHFRFSSFYKADYYVKVL